MATESQRLQTRAIRLARTADRLSARFARQLAGVVRGLDREIAALTVPEATTSARVRIAEAQALRGQIANILNASRFSALMADAVAAPLDRIGSLVLAGRPLVVPQVEALRQVHLLELLDKKGQFSADLSRAATRGLVGNLPRRRMIAELGQTIDRNEVQIAALYDTTVSIFGREVEALTAGPSKETLFLYVGPVDSKIRPWCLSRVGKVFSRADIDAMDNGQLPSPFLTGGGWRCRHQWMEISEASELADLHGVRGGRIPEVRESVRRQQAA